MDASSPVALVGWEHIHRELLAALLCLHHIERSRLRGELRHVRNVGPPRGSEVLFLPFFHDGVDRDRCLFRGSRGRWVVNLAYEQLHAPCARDFLLPSGSFATEQVLHCAWGERFANLLEKRGVPPEHLRRTGHPRFDLYRHPTLLAGRADLAERFGLDAEKRWVLLATSFNRADYPDRLWRAIVRRGYRFDPAIPRRAAAAREAFLALVEEAALAFPELELIVRPHPAGYERYGPYSALAARHAGCHVISALDIANWIPQAALMVVWTSTSSMEAVAAGTPVVAFVPSVPDPNIDTPVPDIVPCHRRREDVLHLLATIGEVALTYDQDEFQSWYGYSDGRAAERVAGIVREAHEDHDRFAVRARDPWLRHLGRRALAVWREFNSRGAWGRNRELPADLVQDAAHRLDPSALLDRLP